MTTTSILSLPSIDRLCRHIVPSVRDDDDDDDDDEWLFSHDLSEMTALLELWHRQY